MLFQYLATRIIFFNNSRFTDCLKWQGIELKNMYNFFQNIISDIIFVDFISLFLKLKYILQFKNPFLIQNLIDGSRKLSL